MSEHCFTDSVSDEFILVKVEPTEEDQDDTRLSLPADTFPDGGRWNNPSIVSNKLELLLEMDKVVTSTVNECVSVLNCDPREYHPFYLRVYKYVRRGLREGWITSEEVDSLWEKYDKLAKFQLEKWRNGGDVGVEVSEESPYLGFIKTGKVIISGQEVERLPSQLTDKQVISQISKEVRSFRRVGGLREDLKSRLEFFGKVKHITYPGHVKIMNNQWKKLLSEDNRRTSRRVTKRPAKLEDGEGNATSGKRQLTLEEKREFSRISAQLKRQNMSEDQRCLERKKARERHSCRVRNMSNKEALEYKSKQKFLRLQRKLELEMMTPHEREQERTKQFLKTQTWLASKDKEWIENYRQKQREKSRQRRLKMTPEEKSKEREKHRNYIRSLTGDKRKKYMENVRKNVKKWMTKKKLENPDWGKEKKLSYQRARTEREPEEKRQARLLRCRLNQARRRARKQLELEGAPETEIQLRLKQIEDKIRKMEVKSVYKPRPGARKSHKMTVKPVGRPAASAGEDGQHVVVEATHGDNLHIFDTIQLVAMDEFQDVPTITFVPSQSERCSMVINPQTNTSCFNVQELQPVVGNNPQESIISTFTVPESGDISLIIVPSNAILVATEPEDPPQPASPPQSLTPPPPQLPSLPPAKPKPAPPPSKSSAICDQCGKSFCNPFGVQLHKNVVHALDPSSLYCPKCHFPASSTTSLWNHFASHHISDIDALPADLFPKKTPILPKLPRDPDLPNKALRSIPGEVSTCPICSKSFTQKCTMTDHIRRVHQGLAHICDICGKDQQSVTKLWRHKVDRHGLQDLPPPSNVPLIKCKYCDDLLMRGYEQHVEKKHPEHVTDFKSWYNPAKGTAPKTHQNGRVQCPHCPSVVLSKLLTRHIKNMHTSRPRFPCPECKFPFKREDHMKKHFKDKHSFGDIERKLEASKFIQLSSSKTFSATCLLCGVELGSRIVLKAHFVATHHQIFQDCQVASLPLFSCPACPEKFQKEKDLHCHVERIHPESIFICDTCPDVKFSKEDMASHQKTDHKRNTCNRQEIKEFVRETLNKIEVKCDLCGQGKRMLGMSKHLKMAHGQEETKEWNCNDCPGLKFQDRRYQVAHMHLEHGSKLEDLLKLDCGNSSKIADRRRKRFPGWKERQDYCTEVDIERDKRLKVSVERLSEDLVRYYLAREIVKVEVDV